MNFLDMLGAAERQNHSMLCVGLDPEPAKFPGKLKGDANKIYDFCAAIVDATADLVISFKPQIAYFAAHRAEGQLERLMEHMRRVAPQVPIILDAKRGDIGSTAEQYAKEAFERYGADAVTLSPFMGFDSVAPYLKYQGKGAFLLCRTSNPGGDDLQNQRFASIEGQPLLYEHGRHQQANQRCVAGLELARRRVGPVFKLGNGGFHPRQRFGGHAVGAAVEHVGHGAGGNPGQAGDISDLAHGFVLSFLMRLLLVGREKVKKS